MGNNSDEERTPRVSSGPEDPEEDEHRQRILTDDDLNRVHGWDRQEEQRRRLEREKVQKEESKETVGKGKGTEGGTIKGIRTEKPRMTCGQRSQGIEN